MIIDPTTRQRVLRMENTGDIVYDLDINAGSSVSMETLPVLGPWTDYTGSDLTISKNHSMFAGAENQFQWTDAGMTENLDRLNTVGQSASTTRRRLIKRYNEGN